jgi:hypothetical protein
MGQTFLSGLDGEGGMRQMSAMHHAHNEAV